MMARVERWVTFGEIVEVFVVIVQELLKLLFLVLSIGAACGAFHDESTDGFALPAVVLLEGGGEE
jgi:hypothetical protein